MENAHKLQDELQDLVTAVDPFASGREYGIQFVGGLIEIVTRAQSLTAYELDLVIERLKEQTGL